MSRPVLIRNGSNSVINVKDKSEKLIRFGNEYHIYMSSLDIPVFNVSSETYGGIVKYNNTPIGVVALPSSVTNDESIRIVSIHNMSAVTPDTGTLSEELMYCPCAKFANYSNQFVNAFYYNQTTYTSSNFPVKSYQDGWVDYKTLIQLSDNVSGERDWRTKNQLNNNKNVYAVAALAAWRYNPISSELNMQGYWYLPSWFELFYEYLNITSINQGFDIIKTNYNIGLGRIPYSTQNDHSRYSYWGSTYKNYQSGFGGNCCKLNVRTGFNTSTYYGTGSDTGMAQAWLKLIKDNNKWILDPTYHID